ncbi:MFP1 attachment factor 1-like [Panicum virgatum]|uniref:MFP1 attachment factor 1-like n=1 Tax=Panicum virgatum TaxID=38727 RepID=UPI0019D6030C|nr:MFP1 attachment factor 1-like [Panicum virgatum]
MREAVMRRIVQTVAAPSVLSRRYGTVPEPEAERAAAAVQAEAFAVASKSAAGASPAFVKEGIEVLQTLYSREVSCRLLELAKSRSAAAVAPTAEASTQEVEESSVTVSAARPSSKGDGSISPLHLPTDKSRATKTNLRISVIGPRLVISGAPG